MNNQFQQIRNDVDHQQMANRMNVTVYVYLLANNEEAFCFIADLKTTNAFNVNGQIIPVVKFLRKYEPETTGHRDYHHFVTNSKAANNFASDITAKYVNTHFAIDDKQTRRGKIYRVTISNLTDDQYAELTGEK